MDREMDPEICSWIIEFVVRNSPDEMLLKKLIHVLPPPPLFRKPRMMKTVLLHTIKSEIQAGDVSEKILDHLEKIERIDCSQRLRILDSMMDAYCAVALECTAKHLSGSWNRDAKNLDAVNIIWRGRLEKSKSSKLVSELLRRHRRQLEAGDEEFIDSLIRTNTRNYAILTLRLYLREAHDLMGSPLLEKMADGMSSSSSSSSSNSSSDSS